MSRNYQNHPDRYPDVMATDRFIDWLINYQTQREPDFFDELNAFEDNQDED